MQGSPKKQEESKSLARRESMRIENTRKEPARKEKKAGTVI